MSAEKDDILRYLKGEMSEDERFAFEKQMLDDPLLNDAVEGFQQMPLVEVEQILAIQHIPEKNRITPWLVAASLVIVVLSAVFILLDGPVQNETVSTVLPEDTTQVVMKDKMDDQSTTRDEHLEEQKAMDPGEDQTESVEEEPEATEARSEPPTSQEVTEAESPLVIAQEADIEEVAAEEGLAAGAAKEEIEDAEITVNASSAAKKANRATRSLVQPTGGRVVANGRPIEGVNLFLEGGGGTLSKADGSFVMESTSRVLVAKNGYLDQRLEPTGLIPLQASSRKMEYEVVTANIYDLFPQPEPGRDAYLQYLSQTLKVPESARRDGLQGTVSIRFTIKRNANLADFQVIQSLTAECDNEAIRLVKDGPAWTPGIVGGRRVETEVDVNIVFE